MPRSVILYTYIATIILRSAAFISLILLFCVFWEAGSLHLVTAAQAASDFELIGTHPGAAVQPTATGKSLRAAFEYQGRIYWGYGDYGANTGPIDIIPLDPETLQFLEKEYTADTEAISRFRVFSNGKLYIPHIDPKLSNDYSRKDPGGWMGVTYTWMWHVYDMAELNGSLFLIGSKDRDAVVYESSDGESTFHLSLSVSPREGSDYSRFYFCGKLNGKLYIQALDLPGGLHPHSRVFDGQTWSDGPDLQAMYGTDADNFAGKMIYRGMKSGISGWHLFSFDGTSVNLVIERFFLVYTINGNELYAIFRTSEDSPYILARTSDLNNWTTISEDLPEGRRSICIFDRRVFVGTVNSEVYRSSFILDSANFPPVAQDQNVTTPEDTARGITLLATDADGDSLTYAIVSNPTHGTLTGTAPDLVYTPYLNFNGSDSFKFRANDGTEDSNIAMVTVTVSPVNDAPVIYSSPITTAIEDSLYAYDMDATDADVGDVLTYYLTTSPNGMSIDSVTGMIRWTPSNDQVGSNSVVAWVKDTAGAKDFQTFNIIVSNVNDPPVAYDTSVSTDEGISVAISLTGSDIDGDSLTYHVISNPTNGTLTGSAPYLTYAPSLNFHGSDSFTFTANDGVVDSNTATVSITVYPVNDPPVAYDTSISTDEDISVAISLTGSDIDGDPLTYHVISNPTNGTLTGSAPYLTYTPFLNFHGSDSFTFKVNDSEVDSNTATVSITVYPVNDPPVAYDQLVFTEKNMPVVIILTGSDIDGDSITYHIASNPANGLLTGIAPNLTYTPNLNFDGVDSFTFRVNDGIADSNAAIVRVVVGDLFSHDMYTGWNLISLPLEPMDTDPDAVLSSLDGRYNSVWAYDPSTGWLMYAPEAPSNLERMEPGEGYWVKMDKPGVLIIRGTTPKQTAISLTGEAWNLVGYISLQPRNIEDCMRSIESEIDLVCGYDPRKGWSVYKPGGASDLEVMEPGRGHWIKANRYCIWNVNGNGQP